MTFREYVPDTDKDAAHRIWREIGWVSSEEGEKAMDSFLAAGRTLVADINGEPECLVASMPGEIYYLGEPLPFSAVTAVSTSRIGRKQGLAKRLTAALIAADAAEGALVSGLGMFEQGFYDKLGYGTGSYEHWVSFDPALLKVKQKARLPQRIGKAQWREVHGALLARQKRHGSCNVLPPQIMEAEMHWTSGGFGLGYYDGPKHTLSHFFWSTSKGEHGPYTILFMAYQNKAQFLELMALIKNLGDQVHMVRLREPADVQLQDLLRQPLKQRRIAGTSEFASANKATAYWQVRICDLAGCLARTHLRESAVDFNLALHDPITVALDEDAPWRGVGGEYVVTLGPESGAEPGRDAALPTLETSVNAFTRLWLGVRPATGLAVTDQLRGPDVLLRQLDRALCLPTPSLDWDF